MPKNPTFSSRLKALRELNNYNQASLADAANVSRSSLSQMESGLRTASLPVLTRLAKLLNTSTDYLLGVVDTVEPAESPDGPSAFTVHEQAIIVSYRKKPKVIRQTVDRILEVV